MESTASENAQGEAGDLDNSTRFDMSDLLRPDFETPVSILTDQIVSHLPVKRVGDAIRSQIALTVSTVAANLMRAASLDRQCYVAISMGSQYYTRSRYNCQGIGYANLRRTIEHMRDRHPAFITYHPGFQDRQSGFSRSTRIRATDAFFDLFLGETLFDQPLMFASKKNDAFECIRLKDTKANKKRLIDYEETADTTEIRNRLEQWNEFIADQWTDLYVTDDQQKTIFKDDNATEDNDAEGEEEQRPSYVDLTRSRLYRVFNNGTFEDGGRFYGGWWQSLPSKFRKYVTINWHPTREIDYSNMQPAMIYALCDLPLDEDAYAIDGIDTSYRKLIKKTLFQLINAQADQRIRAPSPDSLPTGWNWKNLQEAIIEKHQPIKQYLRTGIGIKLQRWDSVIAEDIMHSMMARGILVLPIHDSFIIRRGYSVALREQMQTSYKKHVSADIGTTLDLSFADQLGPGQFLSSFEQIEAALDSASTDPEGYQDYFERKRTVLATKDRAWRQRFRPY